MPCPTTSCLVLLMNFRVVAVTPLTLVTPDSGSRLGYANTWESPDRTHSFLLRPVHSEPRNHASQCSTLLSADQFSIVDQCTNNLLSLESLHFKQLKPSLNSMQSSTPLLVSWRHSRQTDRHSPSLCSLPSSLI